MLDLEQHQDRTLRFLCEAATQYAVLAPAVSRSLGRRLRTQAKSAKVALHPSTEQLFCPKCSQAYVPGSNCHVSTRQRRRKRKPRKKSKKSSNKLTPLPKSSASKAFGNSKSSGAQAAKIEPKAKPKAESKAEPKAKPRAKIAKAKRFVQYTCKVCRHSRRIPLPKRPRVSQKSQVSGGGHRTVAQKKQAAACEEARNAARAAKRQKAKAKAMASAGAKIEEHGEACEAEAAGSSSQNDGSKELPVQGLDVRTAAFSNSVEAKVVQGEAAPFEAGLQKTPGQGQESRRKRKREDKLSQVMNKMSNQRASSSSAFDF
eukprot:Skav202059  [mRNA]  locus=scaffold1138:542258:543205:- [translate_table: standard]